MLKGRALCLAATVLLCAIAISLLCMAPAFAFYKRFECALWGNNMCPNPPPNTYFQQAQFDALNFVLDQPHFLAVPNDNHRTEIWNAGNYEAYWFDGFNNGWGTYSGSAWADQIEATCSANFANQGYNPQWFILNEISAGTWPNNQSYRTWVHDVVHRLHNTYGHEVILCSPFATPGANNADWQAVAADAYIGAECYLSGQEVNASGNSVSWCQSQYQATKNAYLNRGVGSTRIMLVEHYAQTVTNTGWGRSGVSYAGWDNAINARSTAAKNVGFAGHVSYYWKGNDMCTSSTDLVHFINTYAAKSLP